MSGWAGFVISTAGSATSSIATGWTGYKVGKIDALTLSRGAALMRQESHIEALRLETQSRSFAKSQLMEDLGRGMLAKGSILEVTNETIQEGKKQAEDVIRQAYAQAEQMDDQAKNTKKMGKVSAIRGMFGVA